jgi:hypothetical protein
MRVQYFLGCCADVISGDGSVFARPWKPLVLYNRTTSRRFCAAFTLSSKFGMEFFWLLEYSLYKFLLA